MGATMPERDSTEARHRPDVHRKYEGEGIVVHWEPALCIHAANCIRVQPGVFDPGARPWIDLTAADADSIAEAVEWCPTGALRYERSDGSPAETADVSGSIEVRPNGPLYLRGSLQVTDANGTVMREATRLALCRCGQSQNKPYCDNSHRAAGFRG
jgi:uncharacterized Fe-S cluster protein YjdI